MCQAIFNMYYAKGASQIPRWKTEAEKYLSESEAKNQRHQQSIPFLNRQENETSRKKPFQPKMMAISHPILGLRPQFYYNTTSLIN